MRKKCVESFRHLFEEESCYMTKVLDYAASLPHVMDFTRIRVLESTFALVRKGISNVIEFNEARPDFHMSEAQMATYM